MIRPTIARVRLVTMMSEVDTRTIATEFPSIKIERAHAVRVDDAIIDADEWRKATSFAEVDETLARSRGDALMVRGDRHVELVACEALTRYQRFVQRRNGSSRTRIFEQILRAHQALCEPIVTNEFDRALDTWQWMLRLDPAATLTAQLAALFYAGDQAQTETSDVVPPPPSVPSVDLPVPPAPPLPATSEVFEPYGLVTQPEATPAPRPPLHSEVHLRAGEQRQRSNAGAWTFNVLQSTGIDESIAARVREIVALGERRGRDTEMDLLHDATALSFLSLGSGTYLDVFGVDATRRKIAESLAQMGDVARTKLSLVRLRPDVRALIQRSAAA